MMKVDDKFIAIAEAKDNIEYWTKKLRDPYSEMSISYRQNALKMWTEIYEDLMK